MAKVYAPEIKLEAVLESFYPGTTYEEVCKKFAVSRSQLTRWRQLFLERAPGLFNDEQEKKIEALTMQNEILVDLVKTLQHNYHLPWSAFTKLQHGSSLNTLFSIGIESNDTKKERE